MRTQPQDKNQHFRPADGSALIIVLWVAFGLVSIALYFAHSMSMELRAAENRVAGLAADQAIDGASRYVAYLVSNLETPGALPEIQSYRREGVAIGVANFWLIGRDDTQVSASDPYFSLTDENGKINLNTATLDMLLALPRMTSGLAAAIIDWRDADSEVSSGGAEDETYSRLTPAYRCKNAKFESIEELRLVAGADLEILLGEDTNRNGILDPNENDGDVSLPIDNRDGKLDPGILEYVTVYSRESNLKADGTAKTSITDANALLTVLEEKLSLSRQQAQQVVARLSGGGPPVSNLLEFYSRSGLTEDQLTTLAPELSSTNGIVEGLINVNTASEVVLTCVPGIGKEKAATMIAERQSSANNRNSLAWVTKVLSTPADAQAAGPFLTGQSFQYTADIAAVGQNQRGYRRARFVFDVAEGTNRIVSRQDLSGLGWALGRQARQDLLSAKGIR